MEEGSLRVGGRGCLKHMERVKQGKLQFGEVRAAVAILEQSSAKEH